MNELILDVRRSAAFRNSGEMIKGALRRDPETVERWAQSLPAAGKVLVYCVHGHEVSQNVAKALNARGLDAAILEGGIEAWKAKGGALDHKPVAAATRWVTRERPKIDRIACPWLVSRFVDAEAEFLYVPAKDVREVAEAKGATPYDVADVHFTHDGDLCSFDAFIEHYGLAGDPALAQLATIVRGADTARLDLAPQAPGLLALSLGLSRCFRDDHEMLGHGMVVYDGLYAWCKNGKEESHTWNPGGLPLRNAVA
jgi:rhodanese-related sulfurtransferase